MIDDLRQALLKYVLDGHKPVLERDLLRWAEWMGTADRRVKLTEHELFVVTTVFLGLDHRFYGNGPPLVFETIALVNRSRRSAAGGYASWEDAELGHEAMVLRMLNGARASTRPGADG
jgi:hypothetical protein